jgi:hypothetical protein
MDDLPGVFAGTMAQAAPFGDGQEGPFRPPGAPHLGWRAQAIPKDQPKETTLPGV